MFALWLQVGTCKERGHPMCPLPLHTLGKPEDDAPGASLRGLHLETEEPVMKATRRTSKTYSVWAEFNHSGTWGVRHHLHHQTRSRLTRLRPPGAAALQRGGGTGPSNTRGLVDGWVNYINGDE